MSRLMSRARDLEKGLASFLLNSQRFSMPFEELYDRAHGILQKSVFFIANGRVGGGDGEVTLLISGLPETSHALARLFCGVRARVRRIGSFYSWQKNQPSPQEADVSMLFVPKQTARKFEEEGSFLLPSISFSLDLTGSIEEILGEMSGRRRKDVKNLERCTYSPFISRGSNDVFAYFYRNMYVPFTKNRFQKAAYVEAYSKLRNLYRGKGSGILFVRCQHEPVSGILYYARGRTVFAKSMGICGGDLDLVRDSAAQAALFFLIKWAKSQGFHRLDYGQTMPFLSHGIFVYKKEWGMRVQRVSNRCFSSFKIHRINEAVLALLRRNPFLFADERSIKALVLLDHRFSDIEGKQIAHSNYVKGLKSLMIVGYEKPGQRQISGKDRLLTVSTDLPRPVRTLVVELEKQGFIVSCSEYDVSAA